MGRTEQELAILITGKDVSATRALRGVNREADRFGAIAGRAGRNAGRNLERGVVIGATAAVGAIGYAINAAMDWETAWTGVMKTVDETATTSFGQLEEGLKGLAREMPITAAELAQIAENAGAMGIKADDIVEFTRVVAMLGATTNVTTEDAATALGQLQNVLGLTGEDFDNFGASLVDLGNKGASTEAQILEIARRAGGAAKLFGIAKEETLGWAAAAANLGMNEELAGTSLQNVFLKLLPKYTQGAEDLQKITGQTAAQLKQSFEKDASGAVESLIKKIGSMPKDARLQAVQKLFGKGSGLTRLVLGLAESYDKNLVPSLDNAAKSWKDNAALQAEYEKRLATTESQLKIFKNNVDIAAATIGSELLPIVNELAGEVTNWLQQHPEEIAEFAQDLAAGIREAVEWGQKLDWDGIAAALGAGADAAKGIVSAFMAMPPELQAMLAGGYVANKFTGGAVTDLAGLGLKSVFDRLIQRGSPGNPLFVVPVGGGLGGAAGAAGAAGGKGLLAKGLTMILPAAILVEALSLVQDQVVMPKLQEQAGRNVTSTEAVIASGDPAKIRAALEGVQSSVASLEGLNKVLYDLNANGVKTHTEGLVAALTAALAATGAKGMSPDERQEANDQRRLQGETVRAIQGTKAGVVGAVRALDLSVTLRPVTNVNVRIPVSVSVDAQRRRARAMYQTGTNVRTGGPVAAEDLW